jgi:hypothetical protein
VSFPIALRQQGDPLQLDRLSAQVVRRLILGAADTRFVLMDSVRSGRRRRDRHSRHGVLLGLMRDAIDAALAVRDTKFSSVPPSPNPLRQRFGARVALASAEMRCRSAQAVRAASVDAPLAPGSRCGHY